VFLLYPAPFSASNRFSLKGVAFNNLFLILFAHVLKDSLRGGRIVLLSLCLALSLREGFLFAVFSVDPAIRFPYRLKDPGPLFSFWKNVLMGYRSILLYFASTTPTFTVSPDYFV